MPKALELSLETMTAPPVPKAAQAEPPSVGPKDASAGSKATRGRDSTPEKPEQTVPLQVRFSGADVKAVKLAALQLDYPTVSDFMLACFHAYMQNGRAKA